MQIERLVDTTRFDCLKSLIPDLGNYLGPLGDLILAAAAVDNLSSSGCMQMFELMHYIHR